MRENFTPKIEKESSIDTNDLARLSRFEDMLGKCKEFLYSRSKDLRVGAMVVLSMGVFQEVQAQSEIDYFKNALTEIKSGKSDINHLVGKTYDEHKTENIDSSFVLLENSTFTEIDSKKNKKYISKMHEFSGASINIDLDKDTIDLGDVEVKDFFVSCDEGNHVNSNNIDDISRSDYQAKHKWYSAIKINSEVGDNKDSLNDRVGNKEFPAYGKTPEEAIVRALARVSSEEKTYVLTFFTGETVSSIAYDNENSKKRSSLKEKNFSFSYMESNNIFNNVRIVLHKEEVFGEAMYHADVIYK